MQDLEGVKVLITGGASGFGLACAQALVGAGAFVAICDIDEAQLKKAEDSLRNASNSAGGRAGRTLAIQMDVSSGASVRQGIEKCAGSFGGLDSLVSCAGIIKVSALADITEEEWDRVLSVNLKGAFLCAQAAAPYLCRSKRGRIVNIASDAAKIGFPMIASYAASKSGLAGLGRALAAELAPFGVTVNTVCPVGAPDTGMGQQLMKWKTKSSGLNESQVRAAAARGNPIGRNCEARDVANAVMFFLSPASEFLTGQSLDVDGGLVNVHALPGIGKAIGQSDDKMKVNP
jgi:NAD(P)-dependent dehydrogenase (short-subunit alcohol dehydrogenase family)